MKIEQDKYYENADMYAYVLRIIGDLVYYVRHSESHQTYGIDAMSLAEFERYFLGREGGDALWSIEDANAEDFKW